MWRMLIMIVVKVIIRIFDIPLQPQYRMELSLLDMQDIEMYDYKSKSNVIFGCRRTMRHRGEGTIFVKTESWLGEIKACMDLESILNEEYDTQNDLTFLVQRQIKASDSDQVPWNWRMKDGNFPVTFRFGPWVSETRFTSQIPSHRVHNLFLVWSIHPHIDEDLSPKVHPQ